MKTYSTREAAKKLGLSWITLQRWVRSGKVEAPKLSRVGGVKVRLWTKRDITRLRKQRPALFYRGKNRRRKKK